MRLSRKLLPLFCVSLAGVLVAQSLEAQSFSTTINATDSGHYANDGFHVAATLNYVVGNTSDGFTQRNYFVFAIPDTTADEIFSAELRLWNPGPPNPGYFSNDLSETYVLYDVTTSIASLRSENGGGPGGQAIYNDLGAGTIYGSVVVSPASNGTTVSIFLNPAFIAAANALGAGGLIAIGGAITTLDTKTSTPERVFGFTGSSLSQTQLVLEQRPRSEL